MTVAKVTDLLDNNVQAAASYYIRQLGWTLIPIRPGDKIGEPGWNKVENWITRVEQCKHIFAKGFGVTPRGVALMHEGSNTCSIDIDDYALAAPLFNTLGIDLNALVKSTAHFSRTNENKSKAVFTLPTGEDYSDLTWLKVNFNGGTVFEFRSHKQYDVLPPSVHPDGDRYEWRDGSLTDPGPIDLPGALIDLWRNPAQFERDGYTCSKAKKKKTDNAQYVPSPLDDMVLGLYGSVEDLIDSSPEHERVGNRWKPIDSTHAPGLVVLPNGKIFSGHASDPIYRGGQNTPLTPFEFYARAFHWAQGTSIRDAEAQAQNELRSKIESVNEVQISDSGAPPAPPKRPTSVLWVPDEGDEYSDDPASWPLPLSFKSVNRVMFIEPTEVNVERILVQHPALKKVFYFDKFTRNEYIVAPPWEPRKLIDVYQNHHAGSAISWLQQDQRYTMLRRTNFERGIEQLMHSRWVCDALTNHISMLPEWDREPRIDTWLIRLCGAEDEPYMRQFARRFLIGLMARGISPGSKLDTMLILEGRMQGHGKSTLGEILTGKLTLDFEVNLCQAIHLDLSQHDSDAMAKLQGIWLAELGEVSFFRKADRELLKNFLSRTSDHYRTKYEKNATSKPRRLAWLGTTNENDYLDDLTGNRRYWPVKTGTIDLHALAKERDQLLAEALYEYRAGSPWWFSLDETKSLSIDKVQGERQKENPVFEPLREVLKTCVVALLGSGRNDNCKWVFNKAEDWTLMPLAKHGVFLTKDQIYTAANFNRSDRSITQSLGAWLAGVLKWPMGFGRLGNHSTKAHSPSLEWLDENIPDWRNTFIGKKANERS